MKSPLRTVLMAMAVAGASSAEAGWDYSTDIDKMTGKPTHFASVTSNNHVVLSAPYGKTSARIFIRSSARSGRSVIFMSDTGQIMCTSYDPCKITARFDTKPAQRFAATSPSDGSHEAVFIREYTGFVRNLATAKKLLIEVEYFRNGSQQFDFDVAGLVAGNFLPASPTKAAAAKPAESITKEDRFTAAMVRAGGCFSCHAMVAESIGPSFRAIAARYKNDEKGADQLPKKIRQGSSGTWGTTAACPPHPDISFEDAVEMYVWILL